MLAPSLLEIGLGPSACPAGLILPDHLPHPTPRPRENVNPWEIDPEIKYASGELWGSKYSQNRIKEIRWRSSPQLQPEQHLHPFEKAEQKL